MEYKEYEEKYNDTKLYSDEVAIGYVALGLCGELGELYEKISQEELGELGRKEIGDMLWYLVMMRRELNLSFIEKWPVAEEGLKIDPFVLVVEVGKIAEQVKKFMRDDWVPGQKILSLKREKRLLKNLGQVLSRCYLVLRKIRIPSTLLLKKLLMRILRN